MKKKKKLPLYTGSEINLTYIVRIVDLMSFRT